MRVQREYCGDAIVNDSPYEECDDGNDTAGDGCSEGVVEDGYVCDDTEPSVCDFGPSCGDGIVETPETCDDGNAVSGDGCSDRCEVEDGWACYEDDGSVCGLDEDEDDVADSIDTCPDVSNPDNEDLDGDGLGDACDDDIDGDGWSNQLEMEMGTDPENADTDNDGYVDAVDVDPLDETVGAVPQDCACATAADVGGVRWIALLGVALLGLRIRRRR